mmetsp:Transcript_26073/g.62814  ORF Transcript_26073/g.62814 Transcript_26073/m.62814 type:complete len:201 (-) Transcript_26073:1292-1894(-)
MARSFPYSSVKNSSLPSLVCTLCLMIFSIRCRYMYWKNTNPRNHWLRCRNPTAGCGREQMRSWSFRTLLARSLGKSLDTMIARASFPVRGAPNVMILAFTFVVSSEKVARIALVRAKSTAEIFAQDPPSEWPVKTTSRAPFWMALVMKSSTSDRTCSYLMLKPVCTLILSRCGNSPKILEQRLLAVSLGVFASTSLVNRS